MPNRLNGQIALITGGNSGIGLAAARKFVDEGAKVIITGRNQANLDAAVAEIGGNVTAIQNDVSNLEDLDQLFSTVETQFGKLDVLFANAGVAKVAPFGHVEEEFFDPQFDTNVKGLYFTVQKALPLLLDNSSVILNSSILSNKGMANMSVYNATKASVRSFARTWAEELKQRKIRVNVISPGPIETPIYDKLGMPREQVEQMGEAMVAQIPLGRFGQVDEIADAALFLASDESSYVNGADLAVDGGMAQI